MLGRFILAVLKKLAGPTFEVDEAALQQAIDETAREMGL